MITSDKRRLPSTVERRTPPNPKRAESIAMRRIIVETGYWLSPFMKDHPLPVLTEWERTVDLSAVHKAERLRLDVSTVGKKAPDPAYDSRGADYIPGTRGKNTQISHYDLLAAQRAKQAKERKLKKQREKGL